MLAEKEDDAGLYRSVQHALRSSFGYECHDIVSSPTIYMSRFSDSDLSPFDRSAQAAEVIRLLHVNCRYHVISAVTALYMPATDKPARGIMLSKNLAIDDCARYVRTYPHLSGYPEAYLRDIVCLWSDVPPSMTEPDWMDELGKSSRQLQRIKFGNRERGRPGVCQLLDYLLHESSDVLGPVFSKRGLI